MNGYMTGFCSVGFCEGTRPKSNGKPAKVCTNYESCTCACHQKLTQLFDIAGKERVAVPNPEYQGYESGVMDFLKSLEDTGSPLEAPSIGIYRQPHHQEALIRSGEGKRPRGHLENEVHVICYKFFIKEIEGDDNGQCTTKFIQSSINYAPSVGAINRILRHWEAIGFAKIRETPLRFDGFTVAGLTHGLVRMKRSHYISTRRNEH